MVAAVWCRAIRDATREPARTAVPRTSLRACILRSEHRLAPHLDARPSPPVTCPGVLSVIEKLVRAGWGQRPGLVVRTMVGTSVAVVSFSAAAAGLAAPA